MMAVFRDDQMEIELQPIGFVRNEVKDRPMYDKKDASVPEWVDRLMEHYF